MFKYIALAVVLAACGNSDKCSKAYDKLAPIFEKDKKTDKAGEIARCQKELKEHPEREAMLDCMLAIDKPTAGDLATCMQKTDKGGFEDYKNKSKATEASLNLNRIGKISKRTFGESGSFPVGHADAEPTCCGHPDTQNKCAVNAALWTVEPWKTMEFSIDEPHLYRYAFDGKDGKSFTAYAIGDTDCDGKEATFTLLGSLKPDGSPQTTIIPPAPGVY